MPKRVEFASLEDAGRRMPDLIKEDSRKVVAAFAQVAMADLAKDAIGSTPVGPDEDAARRVAAKGSPAYGHMKSRWFFVPAKRGGKVPAAYTTAPPFKRSGDAWRLINDAAHARVIEMGRKKEKKPRKKGGELRQIGSPAAQKGVLGPAIGRQVSNLDAARRKAILKAETK